MGKNRSLLIVLLTLLFQGLIIITINHSILSAQDLNALKSLLPWVNLIVVIIFILTMLSIKRLEEDVENRIRIKLLRKHVLEIESLNLLLRSQKHEYARHIQCLQSLAYMQNDHTMVIPFGHKRDFLLKEDIAFIEVRGKQSIINAKLGQWVTLGWMFFSGDVNSGLITVRWEE